MSSSFGSARLLLELLCDERGRRVVLVSHCLLNENTRYAGGATRPGAVVEIIDELIAAGCGIHQLPCPERLAGAVSSNFIACGSTTPRKDRSMLRAALC